MGEFGKQNNHVIIGQHCTATGPSTQNFKYLIHTLRDEIGGWGLYFEYFTRKFTLSLWELRIAAFWIWLKTHESLSIQWLSDWLSWNILSLWNVRYSSLLLLFSVFLHGKYLWMCQYKKYPFNSTGIMIIKIIWHYLIFIMGIHIQ